MCLGYQNNNYKSNYLNNNLLENIILNNNNEYLQIRLQIRSKWMHDCEIQLRLIYIGKLTVEACIAYGGSHTE